MHGKNIKSYIKTSLLSLLFAALINLLPSPVSFIFEALAAALFAKIAVMYHYKYTVLTGILILAVTAAGGGLIAMLITGITVILLGLSLGLGTRLEVSYYKILSICAFLYLAGSAASIAILKSASVDVFSLESFYEMMNTTIEAMTQSGYYINPEVIDMLKAYLKSVVLFMMQITPAMMIIISAFCAYVLIQIYKRILIKAQIDVRHFVPFDKMHAPKSSGIVFIVLFLLYSAAPVGMFSDLVLNVIIVLGFLFLACGLSLLDWHLKMRGTKKSARRVMEIAIIPLSYMFMMMPVFALLAMGITDSLLDFRKRMQAKRD